MENNKKIQYAVAFSVIAILVFQSFSSIILQSVYALGISYLSDSHLTGRTIYATARTSSYLWVVHGSGTDYKISVFNATMGYVHFMTKSTILNGTGCSSFGADTNIIPSSHGGLEDIIFSCSFNGIYRYSVVPNPSSVPYIGTSGIFQVAPCTFFSHHLTLTDTNKVSFSCPIQDIVGLLNTNTMSYTRLISIPTSECSGYPYATYADESQEVMLVYCLPKTGTSGVAQILLYDMPSPLGFNLVDTINLYSKGNSQDQLGCSHDLGRCALESRSLHGVFVFQYNVNSAVPSGVLTPFGYLGSDVYHLGLMVTDESSIGSIAIASSSNKNLEIIGLNRNSTVDPALLGSLLCTISSCNPTMISGSTSFYHLADDETFYFATFAGGQIGIMNITGAEQLTDNDDDLNGGSTTGGSSGNTTGGTTGGNTTGGNTCDFSDPECTIPKQVGHGLCVFHLFDCDTNDDIKTNGVGFLLLIVMLGLLIVFFAILRKKANLQIHPIIWVGGMLAVFGLAVGAQLIEGYWFILAIVVIVAFGGFNFWNSKRGDG